jgi:diphosphomevalonate decarboxylase
LLHPNTLHIINQIRAFRHDTNIPLCFTLDAGPNVHLLYPAEFATQVQLFIQTSLLAYCQDNYFIEDKVGDGPQKI